MTKFRLSKFFGGHGTPCPYEKGDVRLVVRSFRELLSHPTRMGVVATCPKQVYLLYGCIYQFPCSVRFVGRNSEGADLFTVYPLQYLVKSGII